MATAEIAAGICGFTTQVEARTEGGICRLHITSQCPDIQELAQSLQQVDPFQEVSYRGEGPQALRLAARCCSHPACPVPVGIIKAVEVEAGLALPADVTIKVSR